MELSQSCNSVSVRSLCYSGLVHIYTDSQTALRSLAASVTTSNLVLKCQRSLPVLGQRNLVTIIWVPDHSGVEGNERTDNLVALLRVFWSSPMLTAIVNRMVSE